MKNIWNKGNRGTIIINPFPWRGLPPDAFQEDLKSRLNSLKVLTGDGQLNIESTKRIRFSFLSKKGIRGSNQALRFDDNGLPYIV